MFKMLIKLDDAKIERLDKYDKDIMWEIIDDLFAEHFCSVEIQEDGSHMYYGSPNRPEKQGADIALCYLELKEKDWFAASVEKWIWYEPRGCSNTLASVLRKDAQFAKAYNV